jgi:hypothetical protein
VGKAVKGAVWGWPRDRRMEKTGGRLVLQLYQCRLFRLRLPRPAVCLEPAHRSTECLKRGIDYDENFESLADSHDHVSPHFDGIR